MDAKLKSRRPWSLRRKIFLAILIAVLILALGLGLGLGLTLGQGDDNNDDNNDGNSSPPTPLPTPNTTLPWVPSVSDTWQIILSHPPILSSSETSTTPNVNIFDIDLFDTPIETIQQLHAMGIGWGISVYAFVGCLLLPVPFVFFVFGRRLRAQGEWSRESTL